jgi:hypothetical protein
MSYHTPVVYIFSVLEVNIAILCASIPIFWPIITSFAMNRILVVNEIVVEVEHFPKASLDGQPGISLAERGAWKSPPETPHSPTWRTNRFSTIARAFDSRPSKESNSRATHKKKGSVASSIGRTFRNDANKAASRPSVDSQLNLYKATSSDGRSTFGSLTKSDYDWFAELDKECVGLRTTTKIEKAENPFNSRRPSET